MKQIIDTKKIENAASAAEPTLAATTRIPKIRRRISIAERMCEIAKKDLSNMPFFTLLEVAVHMRFSLRTIQRLVAKKELRAYRFSNSLRIKKQDLLSYINARCA